MNSQQEEADKFNRYSSQKSVSQNLLNTSIIQSYIGLIVFIYANNDGGLSDFEIASVVLACLGITLQLLIFFIVTWLFYVKPDYTYKFLSATIMNGLVTALSGVSLLLGIAINSVAIEVKNN